MTKQNKSEPDPVAIDLLNRTGILDRSTCIELVKSTPIGRIGFWADEAPLVLPVNFAWFDGSIVFRTLVGQKLAAAAQGQTVCFEVDDWNADDRTGWSVVIRGTSTEVDDWAELEQLEHLGVVPWAKETWRPLWIRIAADEITGRSLR
jgi:nitroimidazol reductase NimA-like FMN-containing flavoprotein (pyridoxamine 5'-phosphate oxidase superfamily)